MKRAISWILIAALMLGFVGMIAFTAFAASYVERVNINTQEFKAGDAITTDFDMTVTGGELVEIKGWFDETMQPASGVFEANEIYYLRLVIEAPEGYTYSEQETTVFPNGYGTYNSSVDAENERLMLLDIEFNFNPTQVQRIYVEEMPESIEPGPANAPEEMYLLGPATITATRWVDQDKQEIAAFENGQLYYLEVTLAPESGYEFRDWVDIYGYGGMAELSEIVSTDEAKAWFRYSLLPGVGDIALTVTGLEVGKPISDVKATLSADARVELRGVMIYDQVTDELLSEGSFEKGKRYTVTYTLKAKDGYDVEKINNISVSGVDSLKYHVWNGLLQINHDFITGDPVGAVVLRTSGVELGKPVSDVQLEILEGDNVTLDGITVYDEDYNPVRTGSFEKNRSYQIEYTLKLKEGYDPECGYEITLNDGEGFGISYNWAYIWVTQWFSTKEKIPSVHLTLTEPQVGDKVADCVVTSESDQYTVEYRWVDGSLWEEATGDFQMEHSYWAEIRLYSEEGYIFTEDTVVTLNDYPEDEFNFDIQDEGRCLYVEKAFGFYSESVYFCELEGMPEEIVPGAAPALAELAAYGDVTLTGARWVDADKDPISVFKDGEVYYLEVTLAPAEDFVFRDWVDVYGDHSMAEDYEIVSSAEVKAWFKYSLQPGVGDIALTVTGVELGGLISGVQATLPAGAKVTLTGIEISDEFTGEPVESGAFEKGNRYRITYILEAMEGYDIDKNEDITVNGRYLDCGIDNGVLYITQCFSTCDPVGVVELTSSGLEVGKPVSGVQLTINQGANVTLGQIYVQDYDTGDLVEEGVFEKNRNYQICYTLEPKAGYSPYDGMTLTLNGKQNIEYSWHARYIQVTEFFSTCEVVEQIRLTVPQPQAGKSVADCVVTAQGGECSVAYWWTDLDSGEEATGTFRKGHAYELSFDVYPEEGYTFTEDTGITLNGVEPEHYYISGNGTHGYGYKQYSFREKISSVELTAPASIAKGDKLSADITAPAGANYTVNAQWSLASIDDSTEADQVTGDGVYLLQMDIYADKGYEFAEDVTVLLNGQRHTSFSNYGTELYVAKHYNVGVKIIDRVDITVAEPAVGAVPQEPVFASGAGYQCSRDWSWMGCKTDDLFQADMIEEFAAGTYHYLYFIMFAEEGYAFGEDVQFYVNGKKMPIATNLNVGFATQAGISFGKLQEYGSVGKGDLDGLLGINEDDAIYLLQHVLMPEIFPVEQDVDFDKSGTVNEDDAIFLLQHVLMPEIFPL